MMLCGNVDARTGVAIYSRNKEQQGAAESIRLIHHKSGVGMLQRNLFSLFVLIMHCWAAKELIFRVIVHWLELAVSKDEPVFTFII